MAHFKRLGAPALAALLVAALLGAAPGKPVAAAAEVGLTASIMVPAPAFVPQEDFTGYRVDYSGSFLQISEGGLQFFEASVLLPAAVVKVKKVTLYAYDNDGTYDVCVGLHRVSPALAEDSVSMGGTCTSGGADVRPQVVSTTTLGPRQVSTASPGLVVVVTLGGGTRLYGVKVTYGY